jgi:cell division protein FtsN
MAAPKTSNPREKQRPKSKRLTAEFTSGQLTIGICTFLLVGCVTFVLGIVVGKYQREYSPNSVPPRVEEIAPTHDEPTKDKDVSSSANTPAPDPSPPASSETPKTKAEAPSGPQGIQTSPRLDSMIPKKTSPEVVAVAPAKENTQLPPPALSPGETKQKKPRSRSLPPLGPDPSGSVPPSTPSTASQATVAKATTAPFKVVPLPKAEEKNDRPKKASPEKSPKPTTVAKQSVKKEAKPAPAKPAAAKLGKFGLQVAALAGEKRAAKAEECQRRLKEHAGYDSVVLKSDDGKYHRVVVPGFADRATAAAALKKLKAKAGFSDAWIRELP